MRIYKGIALLLICFLNSFLIDAQEIFQVDKNFKSKNFKDYIQIYQTRDSINPNTLLKNDTINWKKNKVSYGFSTNLFWLKFKIKNKEDQAKRIYLEIDNPHLRYVDFYKLVGNQLVLKYRCGRHLPFDYRPVDNVKFVFPIELLKKQESEFYVKVDKRKSSVSFPTRLWSENEFTKVSNKVNLFNGIYFGGLILAILYSLMAFFNLKRKLYLNYSLYILFLGLYMFTSAGYAFQYFVNDSILFNSYFRVITLTLMIFFHAKFLQSLFKTKKFAKKIDKSITFFPMRCF